ncbi:unnamed protein product, partial [Aphanomyces euteiches]
MKTTMRCCLAVLTYVALVLEVAIMIPKVQEEEQKYCELRWREEDLEKEVQEDNSTHDSISSNVGRTAEDLRQRRNSTTSSCVSEDSDPPVASDEDWILVIDNSDSDDEAFTTIHQDTMVDTYQSNKYIKMNTPTSLDDPYLCCEVWTNFTRVLDQLKKQHEDPGCRARLAAHFETPPHEDNQQQHMEPSVQSMSKSHGKSDFQENPASDDDSFADPHFCCVVWTNFTRLMLELKERNEVANSRARLDAYITALYQEMQRQLNMKPVDLDSGSCPGKNTEEKTTVETTRETEDVTAPKRVQGGGVDPCEMNKLGQEEMNEATSKSDEPKAHVASLRDVDNASWHDDSSTEFHNDTEDKTAVETTEENGDVTPTNCVQGQGRVHSLEES